MLIQNTLSSPFNISIRFEIEDIRVFHICFTFQYFINGKLAAQLYDKRDYCSFSIVKFPYLCSNIPSSLAYIWCLIKSLNTQKHTLRMNSF